MVLLTGSLWSWYRKRPFLVRNDEFDPLRTKKPCWRYGIAGILIDADRQIFEVRTLGGVLPCEPVCVLIGASLPGVVRPGKEELDVQSLCHLLVSCRLFSEFRLCKATDYIPWCGFGAQIQKACRRTILELRAK